jgi:hypothetical protein
MRLMMMFSLAPRNELALNTRARRTSTFTRTSIGVPHSARIRPLPFRIIESYVPRAMVARRDTDAAAAEIERGHELETGANIAHPPHCIARSCARLALTARARPRPTHACLACLSPGHTRLSAGLAGRRRPAPRAPRSRAKCAPRAPGRPAPRAPRRPRAPPTKWASWVTQHCQQPGRDLALPDRKLRRSPGTPKLAPQAPRRPGRGRKFFDRRAAARLGHHCAGLAALVERLTPARLPSTGREDIRPSCRERGYATPAGKPESRTDSDRSHVQRPTRVTRLHCPDGLGCRGPARVR